jgi:hypothetical protein
VTISIQVLPLEGELPQAQFQWDFKTEILVSTISHRESDELVSRTLQLGGSHGSYVSLNLEDGFLAGIEVVVWPQGDVVDQLNLPIAERSGRLRVDLGGYGNPPGVIELDTPLSCTRTSDESRVHLAFGRHDSIEVVSLAENLWAEIDDKGLLAGLWLADVPPFPEDKETD